VAKFDGYLVGNQTLLPQACGHLDRLGPEAHPDLPPIASVTGEGVLSRDALPCPLTDQCRVVLPAAGTMQIATVGWAELIDQPVQRTPRQIVDGVDVEASQTCF